jgi:predicted Zn-dependent protease
MEGFKNFFTNAYVQRIWRAGRVVGLSFGLYSMGYQTGLATFIQNPHEVEEELMKQILAQTGSKKVITSSPEYKRLIKVGNRVITAATVHCHMENQAQQVLVDTNNKDSKSQTDKENEWTEALKRLNGKWEFIIVDAETPNAFVSNLLPRRIVVHEGFFKCFNPTDDELALILAHEISHVIHDHNGNNSSYKMMFLVLQLLSFAFIDPTGGTYFFLIDYLTSFISDILLASYSREHEIEADSTGIIIAALGCFDTKNGVNIFSKFTSLEADRSAGWMDSHPLSADRLKYLTVSSDTHHPNEEKYKSRCQEEKETYYTAWLNWKGGVLPSQRAALQSTPPAASNTSVKK